MRQFFTKMITVIGESNIDICVSPRRDTSNVSATSNQGCTPSHIAFHHGGVARNIAHNLCLLGHEVRLMTVFGGDDFATNLIADCKKIGMDLSLSTQFENAKSPIFLSINDKIGEMRSAFSDTEINNRMDLDWVKGKIGEINRSESVVADTLLTIDALSYLIDFCEVPLYIDAVSPKRARNLVEALKTSKKQEFFALKCNLSEATAITNKSIPFEAAKALNTMGIKEMYLTLGEKGVVFSSTDETKHFPALPTQVVNVTGSGDAFLAGVVHANAMGRFGKDTVSMGLLMAKANCEVGGTVNEEFLLFLRP